MFGCIERNMQILTIINSIIGKNIGQNIILQRLIKLMAHSNIHQLYQKLALLHPRMFSPVVSVLTMFSFASILILFFNPDRLSEICIFSIYCFYLIAFFGLFKLRKQRKDLVRPFKVPLYPLTPIIAILG